MSASQSPSAEKNAGEPQADTGQPQSDRRTGVRDRRVASIDRRNEDRVADDFDPRRNPDIPDRRQS